MYCGWPMYTLPRTSLHRRTPIAAPKCRPNAELTLLEPGGNTIRLSLSINQSDGPFSISGSRLAEYLRSQAQRGDGHSRQRLPSS